MRNYGRPLPAADTGATRLWAEVLAVTAANTLAAPTYTPDGKIARLTINNLVYYNLGSNPALSVSNGSFVWNWNASNSGQFSLATSDVVIAEYSY